MLVHGGILEETHVTALLQILIGNYFGNLYSVLIVHNATSNAASNLQLEYLNAVQLAFRNQSQHGKIIGVQWIDVAKLNHMELNALTLRAVDISTEGFITILSNTTFFLHSRYYATRNAELRLKDKFYLFLCENESPEKMLTAEILQFYPHHLMIVPTTTKSRYTLNGIATPEPEEELEPKPTQTTKITKATLNKYPKTTFTTATSIATITTSKLTLNSVEAQLKPTWGNTQRDFNLELWTQKFVGSVGNLDAVPLDAFLPNKTFTKNVELYPNKVTNLKGRTLRVGSITYIPYVVTNYVSAGLGNTDPINTNHANRTVYYTGSEANIVKTFCQVRNCHLRVEPYGVDDWGAIYDNETATGNLGGIYAQHIELAIGCFYNWYNNITETSGTIARSAVTLLGPAPALHPAWRTNIMPFSNKLWVFLLCTLSLCSFLMYFIKFSNHSFKHSKNRVFRHMNVLEHSVLNIFAIFIQQPYAHTGLHYISIRVFLTALLCAALTLENIYSGQLKSILTIPFYSEPIDTTYKWSQINWKWAAPAVIWVKTIENSDLVKEQVLTKNFETRNYDFLYNASFRNDYGIGIERLMSGSFSFSDFLTTAALDNKIVLKDDLYFDWTRAISIRGWPLMPLFNEHILICIETGLFIHWEKEAAEQYLNRQVQDMMFKLASGHINKVPPRKLTVENISAALFALGFGYLIAAIVLLLEIFTSKLTQSSNEIKKKATLKRKQRMLNKKLQS